MAEPQPGDMFVEPRATVRFLIGTGLLEGLLSTPDGDASIPVAALNLRYKDPVTDEVEDVNYSIVPEAYLQAAASLENIAAALRKMAS